MPSADENRSFTFNELLTKTVESQISAVDQAGSVPREGTSTLLSPQIRQSLLEQAKEVTEDTDSHKLFDRTSLKQIGQFF